MTTYAIDQSDGVDYMVGRLELPISVGSVGGIIHMKNYAFTHKLLGNPDAATIAQILVTVGLAQNFSALCALSTSGIQKGHMSLHARSVATASGCPPDLVTDCAKYMVAKSAINKKSVNEFLRKMH